jgi:hypothetical protein
MWYFLCVSFYYSDSWSEDTDSQVTSSTGQVWMDRNLGASQMATSSTDPAS